MDPIICADCSAVVTPRHNHAGRVCPTSLDAQVQALAEALRDFTPDDPFVGDELSGGPACIGCGSDHYNARHNEPDQCRWVRARAALALLDPRPAPIGDSDAIPH